MFFRLLTTPALLAALSNSPSLTTELGSSVFINPNIQAISHGPERSESANCNHSNWDNHSSNCFTIGLALNLSYSLLYCFCCTSVRSTLNHSLWASRNSWCRHHFIAFSAMSSLSDLVTFHLLIISSRTSLWSDAVQKLDHCEFIYCSTSCGFLILHFSSNSVMSTCDQSHSGHGITKPVFQTVAIICPLKTWSHTQSPILSKWAYLTLFPFRSSTTIYLPYQSLSSHTSTTFQSTGLSIGSHILQSTSNQNGLASVPYAVTHPDHIPTTLPVLNSLNQLHFINSWRCVSTSTFIFSKLANCVGLIGACLNSTSPVWGLVTATTQSHTLENQNSVSHSGIAHLINAASFNTCHTNLGGICFKKLSLMFHFQSIANVA